MLQCDCFGVSIVPPVGPQSFLMVIILVTCLMWWTWGAETSGESFFWEVLETFSGFLFWSNLLLFLTIFTVALRCSELPVALPCDDLCVLNKHFPGHHLGNPPCLEALGCISTGRKEFRGIYQALSTSAELSAVQKVPFLYQKACCFCSPDPGRVNMVMPPGGVGELWVPITSLSSLFKRKTFKIFPQTCFELLSSFLFLLHPQQQLGCPFWSYRAMVRSFPWFFAFHGVTLAGHTVTIPTP